jgi:hypothetical protein
MHLAEPAHGEEDREREPERGEEHARSDEADEARVAMPLHGVMIVAVRPPPVSSCAATGCTVAGRDPRRVVRPEWNTLVSESRPFSTKPSSGRSGRSQT